MVVLGGTQPERAGERAEDLRRRLRRAGLFEPDVVVGRHRGQLGDLLAAEARRTAAVPGREPDVRWPQPRPPGAQEVGQLGAVHAFDSASPGKGLAFSAVGTGVDAVDVMVIGAGQGGLSAAYFLRRFGFSPIVLDASPRAGGAWQHRSPSLTMRKVHGIFDLPGYRFARSPGDEELPAAEVVPAYFAEYERQQGLDVLRPVQVTSVSPEADGRLLVSSSAGSWLARAVVSATGTWSRPYWPYYPGAADFRGRQLHSADYRGPSSFAGLDVVVVGGGNSATHILSELGPVAASTLWVTRREPVFHTEEFTEDFGRRVVAMVEDRVRNGLPPQSVVSVTGLGYTEVVRSALANGSLRRLPMFASLAADGAVWPDGTFHHADAIVWATGFRASLGHLAPLHLREPGGGIRMEGTRAVLDPRVHLVGYGPSASTVGANRAGRAAARELADLLSQSREPSAA
jgi:cation diffusion facilitator CzcD-associated flavoprotein CzcO